MKFEGWRRTDIEYIRTHGYEQIASHTADGGVDYTYHTLESTNEMVETYKLKVRETKHRPTTRGRADRGAGRGRLGP